VGRPAAHGGVKRLILRTASVAARPQRLNLLIAERFLSELSTPLVDVQPETTKVAVDERRALRRCQRGGLPRCELVLEPGLRRDVGRSDTCAKLRGDHVERLRERLTGSLVEEEVRHRAEDVRLRQLSAETQHPAGLYHESRRQLTLIAEIESVRAAGLHVR